MRAAWLVFLAGCAAPAAVVRSEPAEAPVTPSPVTYAAATSEEAPPPPRPEPCPECGARRAELEGAQKELEAETEARAAYVAGHCKGTVTHTTIVRHDGARVSGGPERAWLCDGKLVEVPETPREQVLATRIGDLHHWIKKNCESTQPRAFGARRCVAP